MLQVTIEEDHSVPRHSIHASSDGGFLAKVSRKAQEADLRLLFSRSEQFLPSLVLGAIVDQDELVVELKLSRMTVKTLQVTVT